MGETGAYAQYLERIPLFQGWAEEEVADFLRRGTTHEIPSGNVIFERGTRGGTLYIVFSGIVDVFAGEFPLAQCNVGDALGLISAVDHRQHTATAVAGSNVLLFEMLDQQVKQVLRQPYGLRFLLNVVHALSGHIANANTHIAAMESKLARIERTRTPVVRE